MRDNRRTNNDALAPVEEHPFEPFVPHNARVLLMGTFPPPESRWSMKFYYPNRANDFWYMMGLVFEGDRYAFYDKTTRSFNLPAIRRLLTDKGIALNDTGRKVRRLRGNASDAFLEIVEPVPLDSLLALMPGCRTIATTGEKAAAVIATLTHSEPPALGKCVTTPDGIAHWRMPSTSRAYPLALERKAEHYARMFHSAGISGVNPSLLAEQNVFIPD